MVVDHIGYVVRDIEKARHEFGVLGYEFEDLIEDFDRNIYILFGDNGNIRIELIQTMNTEKSSPVREILRKNGPTPYHICYKTDDMEADIQKLKFQKWLLINPPRLAVAFAKEGGGVKVAFLMHRQIGMIELVEKHNKN